MKKLLTIMLVLVLGVSGVSAVLVYDLIQYADTPVFEKEEPVTLEISRGQSFASVIRTLEEKGIIAHPIKFKVISRYTGHDKTTRFGEYHIDPQMTPMEILNRFSSGQVVLHKVTIPEGFNMANIAARLESTGLCDREKFMALATDPEFVESLGIGATTLEGYLFPDSYFFEKNPSERTVIRTMVGKFNQAFDENWRERAEEMGFTVHEIVTLASIIEKETGHEEERAKVASVFHNRLKRNMRLDSDPTVIYGIENFDGRIRTKHLRERTPYNTYTSRGLPPGPIASPGFASLHAALFPIETDYLFFVAKSDREHYFSKNYEEHKRAVQKYILGNK